VSQLVTLTREMLGATMCGSALTLLKCRKLRHFLLRLLAHRKKSREQLPHLLLLIVRQHSRPNLDGQAT
jgi:hypothetical protein